MKRLVFSFAIALTFLTVGFAQAQDVAHVDYQDVIKALPDYKQYEADMKTFQDKVKTEVERRESEMKSIYDEATTYAKNLSEAQAQNDSKLQEYQKQLQEKQQGLRKYQEESAKLFNEKDQGMLNPIIKKVDDAINAVAARKGIKYVLDVNSALYYNGGYNLTNEVKKELGM